MPLQSGSLEQQTEAGDVAAGGSSRMLISINDTTETANYVVGRVSACRHIIVRAAAAGYIRKHSHDIRS